MKNNKKHENRGAQTMLSRRTFLDLLAGAGGLALAITRPGIARPQSLFRPEVPERPTFFFAQLAYGKDMSWNPNPTAARSLMEILIGRTSVPAATDRVDLRLSDPKLFRYPFLYWTGTREFEPFPDAEIERLRNWLEFGGFLLVDDALSASGVGFDKAFQRELSRMFPGERLEKLPQNHTVFQSYYLLDRVAGRTANRAYLSGLTRGDRTMLMYSANDLGGAWARDQSGRWQNRVEPGGESQREMAIRMGINVIMYALCINYKQDLIHVPFISERRKGKP